MRYAGYLLTFSIGCFLATYATLWEVKKSCIDLGAVEISGDFFSCEYKRPNDDPLPPW